MSSTGETPSNIQVKPNPYTEKSFLHIKEVFVTNLFFIHDNGKVLETDKFFDLCIGGICEMQNQGKLPKNIASEILTWLVRRKDKIGYPKISYEDKKRLFRYFLEDYYKFFGLDKCESISGLTGPVSVIVNNIIEEHAEDIKH